MTFADYANAGTARYVRMRKVHSTQKLASTSGGGVRLTMTVGDLKAVASWVLEWGERARVVQPPELVDACAASFKRACAVPSAFARVAAPLKAGVQRRA
jgi:predicted DNA-binding transcriptional regulator YafY